MKEVKLGSSKCEEHSAHTKIIEQWQLSGWNGGVNCKANCNELSTVYSSGVTSCCEATPVETRKPYNNTICRFVANKLKDTVLLKDPYAKHKAVLCRGKFTC